MPNLNFDEAKRDRKEARYYYQLMEGDAIHRLWSRHDSWQNKFRT
ncbi:hypothetical protein [Nostoc sp. DSM 114167]|jgi:hypothetical protein